MLDYRVYKECSFMAINAKFEKIPPEIFFWKISNKCKNQFFFTGATHEFLSIFNRLLLTNFSRFLKNIFSHWFRFRTNAEWLRQEIRILKQSCLALIFDRHIDIEWARLWWAAPRIVIICNFWFGIARKFILTLFFIVFSLKRNRSSNKKFFLNKLIFFLQKFFLSTWKVF